MQDAWSVQVWGDFWVLTTLADHEPFMRAIEAGRARQAWDIARRLDLAHPAVLEIG